MAIRMVCARWLELKDEQILAVRTERRSNRLNASGMNKIARSRSATPYGINRKSHVQTCSDDLPCCVGGDNQCCFGIYRIRPPMTGTAPQPISRIGNSARMTEYLIAARAVIILWTSVAVIPAEMIFDVIEAQLKNRGIEP
jgi:hypothetical protein